MDRWTGPAWVGVVGGLLLFAALFLPAVVWQSRRYGRLSVLRLIGTAALAVYGTALVAYTLLPLPSGDLALWCAEHGVGGAQLHPFQFVAESLVPVRAFENQLYIAYVNRAGTEGEFEFVGLSVLAGPDGVARARAGRTGELLVADADPALLAASREANPYLRSRRPGLYGSLL